VTFEFMAHNPLRESTTREDGEFKKCLPCFSEHNTSMQITAKRTLSRHVVDDGDLDSRDTAQVISL
jgi:hypothetical protein